MKNNLKLTLAELLNHINDNIKRHATGIKREFDKQELDKLTKGVSHSTLLKDIECWSGEKGNTYLLYHYLEQILK